MKTEDTENSFLWRKSMQITFEPVKLPSRVLNAIFVAEFLKQRGEVIILGMEIWSMKIDF